MPTAPAFGREAVEHDARRGGRRRAAQRRLRATRRRDARSARAARRIDPLAGSRAAMTRSRAAAGADAAAEHHRAGGAVDLGDRDHHRRLDRRQALAAGRPTARALELQRVGGDVGHVERGERLLGGGAVVVGRAADEAEAGQRQERVDAWSRRRRGRTPRSPGGRRGRWRRRAARAGRGPRARGSPRRSASVSPDEHVGAHQQEADRAGGAGGAGDVGRGRSVIRAGRSGW